MTQLNNINFAGLTVTPSKVVCVGRNYLAHINELGNEVPTEPVIFIKPNSAIGDELLTNKVDDIHYEAELCLLIKNGVIAGIGFGLDLTKRKVQANLKNKGLPWERAKAFDNSAVFSEFVPVPKNVENVYISLSINGETVQHGTYSLMIHKPHALVANIKKFMTLCDFDIVMTGTPSGVGKIEPQQAFKGGVFDGNTCLVSREWMSV